MSLCNVLLWGWGSGRWGGRVGGYTTRTRVSPRNVGYSQARVTPRRVITFSRDQQGVILIFVEEAWDEPCVTDHSRLGLFGEGRNLN